MTTIGIIGAGHIGSQLARLAIAADYDVVIANSRGPETLSGLVAELGPHARAATAAEAAAAADVAVVTVPFKAYDSIPVEPLAGKIVIDTDNYYWERDGHVPAIDEGRITVTGMLQQHLPTSHVAKGFNHIVANGPHHRRQAGRVRRPSRTRDRERPRGCRAVRDRPLRPVRLRYRQRRPAVGELAHRPRPAGLRRAPDARRVRGERREGPPTRRHSVAISSAPAAAEEAEEADSLIDTSGTSERRLDCVQQVGSVSSDGVPEPGVVESGVIVCRDVAGRTQAVARDGGSVAATPSGSCRFTKSAR